MTKHCPADGSQCVPFFLGAHQADHGMACLKQIAGNRGADPTTRTGQEYMHSGRFGSFSKTIGQSRNRDTRSSRARPRFMSDALAVALRKRGVADLQAILAARAGMAAFVHAAVFWLENADTDLGARLDFAERELRALL